MRNHIIFIILMALLFIGCQKKDEASPPLMGGQQRILMLTLMGGQQRILMLNRPDPSFFRLTIIEDGTPWSFQVLCYDTTFAHQFCTARNIQVCVAACNAWGDCSDTVCSDIYEVQPDTLLIPLTATTGTDYNWIQTPENLSMASNLSTHIQLHSTPPTPCHTVSQWNPVAQTYTIYTTIPIPTGNFSLSTGNPVRVEVDNSCIYHMEQFNPKVEKWRWKAQADTSS